MTVIPKNVWIKIIWIAISIYFALTLFVGLSYHWGFLSTLTDIGTFDQAVWGVLNGNFFLNTNVFNKPINYLGIHFRPILFIFVPFYKLSPKVEWMIFAQSFALSITAWIIFSLSKHVTKSNGASFLWALVYMVNPFVLNVSPWVFRPESLAVPFVALTLLAVEKHNFFLLLFSCLFILLCKEHFGVMVIGLGVLWGLRHRKWKQTVLLVSAGLFYSILILGIVMPALSPIGKHVMLGENLGQLNRYSWLGHSMREVIQNTLLHPINVIKTVMIDMKGAFYLLILLITFLGFPLAAPEFFLPGIADLAANMLSANPMPRSPFAYHSVCLVPVLTVAGIYGVKRFSFFINKFTLTELVGFVAVASCIMGYYFAPLPLPGARNDWAPVNLINLPDPLVPTIRSAIGDNASVSVQENIGAHFSQRNEIYRFPNKIGHVDAIILCLNSPTEYVSILPNDQIRRRQLPISKLAVFLHMTRKKYLTSIESILSNKDYGVLLWSDPWLVMKKGVVKRNLLQTKEIKQKLNHLKKEWKINLNDSQ